MSLIAKLYHLMEDSQKEYEQIKSETFIPVEKVHYGMDAAGRPSMLADAASPIREHEEPENLLVHGDNLTFMKYLLEEKQMAGKVKLIYIDPPFFSKANYEAEVKLSSTKVGKIPVIKQKAYEDIWEEGMESYLRMLTPRLLLMKELLADDGSLWVHLDWHSAHYVKIILDEIFGEKNFINEIIWTYKSGGVSKRYFARKHDTLFFYAKTPQYDFYPQQEKSYNRGMKPYRFKGVKEYQDELGWYTMVNRKDVWPINMVGRTSGERTGYATQKPEELIERILESCTREGDLCADFFSGSGTLAATADRMNRHWIASDIGQLAIASAHKRLAGKTKYGYLLAENPNPTASSKATLTGEIRGADQRTFSLLTYDPGEVEALAIAERHGEKIREVVAVDSLQLIDYWSIDFDYDGIEYRPELFFSRTSQGMPVSCVMTRQTRGTIAVLAIDIFGKRSFMTWREERDEEEI